MFLDSSVKEDELGHIKNIYVGQLEANYGNVFKSTSHRDNWLNFNSGLRAQVTFPVLYSYRRCPYAIRARMALKYAGIEVGHREIELRNKPQSMLRISPKGTVPVLCVGELTLEHSLDIVRWALDQSDPDGWGAVDQVAANCWVEKNDGLFKRLLDRYKYIDRYPDLNQGDVLAQILTLMLKPMETTLQSSQFLLGENISWVDIAIFPFIRQFALADSGKFNDLQLPCLKRWLSCHLESELFLSVMHKYPTWTDK